MDIKAGTCPDCVRAITQNVSGKTGPGWDWTVDPAGPNLHWARPLGAPRAGGIGGAYEVTRFETACRASLEHARYRGEK